MQQKALADSKSGYGFHLDIGQMDLI